MTQKPTLLLLPNLLGEHRHHEVFLPSSVDRAVATLDGLIAESEQAGRRFLGRFDTKKPARDIPIALYNEHTSDDDLDFLLEPIRTGERWGLVSDAGLPCVADPGHKLVKRARETGISIQVFIGPSSIMLALLLSGLPGQYFTFHGYLSKIPEKRREEILAMEKTKKTQIFIEAPYRNRHLLEALIENLADQTTVCVACDLTLPTQTVISQTVRLWKKSPFPNLDKRPAVFLIGFSK